MQILHNMTAVMAAEQHGINASNYQKSAKKLGSGYRINTAADDAAQLSISEKMRAQVRGLNKAVNNAEEGASYIQVADGAMNEIHSMLHRMRELSIQSLNDTNTPEDRMAMAMEMDKLQTEIDRIDTNTYYNNLPVFQEHEPSYYQLEGNRVWASNQQHSIVAPDNSLNIHLPAGEFSPDTYTITVPEGIYTTQELMDEIDDAFAEMQPSNPGFVMEYLQDGRCSLNFEGEDGKPTKIDSIDGSLAYLIYDCYNGLSSTSLLGTTAFQGNWPLKITFGQNDEMMFQIEPTDGSPSTPVTLKIPPGQYSRSEMIKLLNQKLAAYPDVEAKEYGNNCIQITGGYDNNITGLKGNMFKLELGSEHKYTSVFYDNIRHGTSIGTSAYIIGKAYYNPVYTNKIKIDTTNNQLKFDYNGKPIIVTIPPGDYIIDNINNTDPDNLTYVLNEAITNTAGADISVKAYNTTDNINEVYTSYKYLEMTSESTGRGIEFKFDMTGVYGNTYRSLFETTNYDFNWQPSYYPGKMHITGAADLSGKIEIINGANTLSLSVNKSPEFTITIPPGTYNSLADLVKELNHQLPAGQKGVIEFAASGNRLLIKPLSSSVSSLEFGNTSGAYKQLFTGMTEEAKEMYLTAKGKEHYNQGATAPDVMDMASVTLTDDIPNGSTVIDGSNNYMELTLNGSYIYVTLDPGTYTRAGLIDQLNKKFTENGFQVEASLTGNRLTLTTTLTGTTRDLSLTVDTRRGSAWKAFVGTEPVMAGPDMPGFAQLYGNHKFSNITLDNTNNNFEFELTDGTTCSVTLPAQAYTIKELADALQVVIDSQIGAGKIKITNNSGTLKMEAIAINGNFEDPAIQNSGFYKEVFGKTIVGSHKGTPINQEGTHDYDEAFIVGRNDITSSPIEIVNGMNDKFIIDLTYKSRPSDPKKDYTKPLEVTIPPGAYTGSQIANLLTPALNAQLAANNITGFELKAEVGGHNTGVSGSIDSKALQITLLEATQPGGGTQTIDSASGSYILDGVRGSAASSIFYKTSGKPQPSYVTGAQNITGGVILPPGKNTLTLKADGVQYSYTFPKDFYNANELVDFLNDKFEHGDDTGQTVPLVASLEDGRLKFMYKVIGNHTITEIGGSAKGIVFYCENGRKSQDRFMLQVGALGHQGLELPRLRVGTAALKINSITITKPKYAEKALRRLDEAIDMLSAKRSTYGALQNRIEHLNANNRNTSENVQASESRMRDANMAAEMVEYLKHQLLTQVSESVLAQANQLPNRLLNLLQ